MYGWQEKCVVLDGFFRAWLGVVSISFKWYCRYRVSTVLLASFSALLGLEYLLPICTGDGECEIDCD
ncbi:hypothetical protein EYC80_004813 [Monilinia laxa]|uniref:Uncharacterized protein n=1 Tax=Monilinia laxa TaxID=61186 RepID=A0A5N6KHY5_MONLA|nr:hypothetical protein EYC80_004813 [Monilinia laxa]